MSKEVNAQELAYVSDTSAAILSQSSTRSKLLLWSVAAFCCAALVWAKFAQIDEVTVGFGKVIPSQKVQTLQNLEGGILEEMFVREGERVKAGQALVRIDDTRFRSDFREAEQRLVSLQGKVARLQAEINSIVIANSDAQGAWREQVRVVFIEPHFEARFISAHPNEVKSQQLQQQARLRTLKNQLAIAARQIEQREQEALELESNLEHMRRSYQLVQQEVTLTSPLVKEGVVSKVELLQLRRESNELLGKIEAAELQLPRINSAIIEAIYKRRDQALAFVDEVREELTLAQGELLASQEGQVGLRDRVDRTLLVSPVAGTVKKIHLTTLGGVVQPGVSILDIVPSDDELLVEVNILPQDIAFLRPGLATMVKFSAYDFSIYGGLSGELEHISADTIVDEEGNSFYLARVRTTKSHLEYGLEALPIIPGMLANVDIVTGKKSILDYLLKPIIKAKQNALRER